MRVSSILSLALVIVFRPCASDDREGEGFSYLGCYKDSGNRALPVNMNYLGVLNQESCYAACIEYPLFALQNGGDCWCGESYDQAIQYGVSTACPSSGLGVAWVNDLYEIIAAEPTSAPTATTVPPTTEDPCDEGDDAQCADPFVCDADADQFETVSDAQYPCKRDCDLFGIDEYLDQCSAVFPAAIETVTASIGRVDDSVLQITNVDIPAVTERVMVNEDAVAAINSELGSVETRIEALNAVDAATDSRVTLNEDAVADINTALGSVGSLIAALNDIDASTNSSVVAAMSLAERNEAAIGSLEEAVAFLQSRVAGFGAADAAAAKSADGQLDVGGELFGSTAQLPYKDALIGALVATNLIIMACFVYFAMTKRCNAKHKYVSVVNDEESDREKLNI